MHVEHDKPELPQNEAFQRREWLALRVAFFVFAAILLAAALGLFGGGPLSHASAENHGASAAYERFLRRDRQTAVTITTRAPDAGSLIIEATGPLFAESDIQEVFPRAVREDAIAGGVRLVFGVEPGAPVRVIIRMTPKSAGSFDATLRVNGAPLSLSSLVYP